MSGLPIPGRSGPDVSLIRLSDGREVHLDDIATAAEAKAILDDVEGSLLGIEETLTLDDGRRGPDWRKRAEIAQKRKRRQRPALQRLLSELRQAERRATCPDPATSRKDAKRRAFLRAAEELLPAETVTELWARAAERFPDAFEGEGAAA